MCIAYLGEMASGCTLGRRQAGGGSDALSSGVHSLMGHNCFVGKKGTYLILGR